ncbi:MAG TPA: ABC transporter permease [Chryseolinea sp.]
MIKNYILIGFRNLVKHRFYSIINVAGLGLGIAASLLLVSWIIHELSYDRFHRDADHIYRSSLEYSFGGQTAKTSVSPTKLLPTLQKNFAEVEDGVRLYNPSTWSPYIVKNKENVFQEGKFFYADSTFFNVFSFALIEGDPLTALKEPNSVILTRSTAKKYFGNEDVIGKTLEVNSTAYNITGLLDDIPTNSIIDLDFLGSFSSLPQSKEQIWWSANYETYVRLAPSTDIKTLTEKTEAIVRKELASELASPGDYVRYNFMRLTDIYLRSDMSEWAKVSDIKYIYIFGAIACLVLLIACINYINLATARAADRAKEVGIRKVVGAMRNQLLLQFIGESLIITLLSLCVGFLMVRLALPAFTDITGKSFAGGIIFSPLFMGISVLIAFIIALAAGAYPAIAITSFKPVSVLKGSFKTSRRGTWLRQGLVVFQFCISTILVIGTLVVVKQLDFLQQKKLGYDRENTLIIPLDGKTDKVYNELKTEVMRTGVASNIARATESPTFIAAGYSLNVQDGSDAPGMIVTAMSVDAEFIPTLGMEFATGRNFTEADIVKAQKDTTSSSYSFIINESTLRELSIDTEKAIGLRVSMNGRKGEIIGVLKDFHFAPLHKKIGPLVLFNQVSDYHNIFIKLKSGDITESVASVKRIYNQLVPHRPFEYQFIDQRYNSLYDNEQRMAKINTVFALLAIVIACLGLLGLVSFSAAQKTKEIGIRKVLGATASSIVLLITKDFTRLVVIALMIGFPIAYWIMDKWLSDFAYKTEIGLSPVLLSSLLCVVIAFGTASYQAVKAALINPADTLRNE